MSADANQSEIGAALGQTVTDLQTALTQVQSALSALNAMSPVPTNLIADLAAAQTAIQGCLPAIQHDLAIVNDVNAL